MTQVELIEAIKQIPGFQSMYHRAEDFRDKDQDGKPINGTGRQQIYTVWQRVNGVLKNHRIDILVLEKGTAEETAEPFTPLSQFSTIDTPLLDELNSKIPAYQAAHTEIEKVTIDKCDEARGMARITTYEYDAATEITTEQKKIVYRVSGNLKIRNFKSAITVGE